MPGMYDKKKKDMPKPPSPRGSGYLDSYGAPGPRKRNPMPPADRIDDRKNARTMARNNAIMRKLGK